METSKRNATWKAITTADAFANVKGLLNQSGLRHDDLRLEDTWMFGYFYEDELIATAALEPYDGYWLLRSVAVARPWRGQGLGTEQVKQLVALPEVQAGKGVYLLTETSSGFFTKLGFREIPRSQTPQAISKSTQFSDLCPQTAIVMKYTESR